MLPRTPQLLKLHYYRDEMDVAAIAAAQSRTVEAIYKSLQRVRQTLLDCIESKLQKDTLDQNRQAHYRP